MASMNIAEWSDDNIHRFGEYDAVVTGDGTWSSTDLHNQSCRLSSAFVALGVAPGDRVLLLLPNCRELIVAFTAALRCGATAVPVFSGTHPVEFSRVVSDSRPAVIVTTADRFAQVSIVRRTVQLVVTGPDDVAVTGVSRFESLCAQHPSLPQAVARHADAPAFICYTSGTGETARGVVYTHGSVHNRHPHRQVAGLKGPFLAALPLATMGAAVLTARLATRLRLVVLPGFDPTTFLSAIERHRVETILLVPSMAAALLATPELSTCNRSSVRKVILTGSHVPADLESRLSATFNVRPIVGYGMTEAGGRITETSRRTAEGSVGQAVDGVEIRVVDPEGRDAPGEVVGEVWVKTPWMAAGYHSGSGASRRFSDDGWLKTGDLGYLDDNRNLYLVARQKDVIIQNGVNVHPDYVADLINRLPDVLECAVVGLPHALLGEEVVACVVLQPGSRLTTDDILVHCRLHSNPRTQPSRAAIREALPRTHTGKVKLAELRRLLMTESADSREGDLLRQLSACRPSMRLATLHDAIEELLTTTLHTAGRSVNPDDQHSRRFGERGLDSIGAARFSYAIGAALGRSVSPTLVYQYPSIPQLAEHLLADIGAATRDQVAPRPSTAAESIAIIGCGCRLPGQADSPDRFWSLLRGGVDATKDISRWNLDALFSSEQGAPGKTYTRRAALLDDAELFDAEFFNIAPREAMSLDPQHRIALEVTWEAIERAGYDARRLSKGPVGVFLGISGAASADGTGINAAPSMAVGRLCHFFNFNGPAAVIDTACSSSLAAIHMAIQSLRSGECDVAIAGGVKIIGSPSSFVGLSEMGVLSPDGRCKSFDARANGYGRGEGCVILVLKRLPDAEAACDAIVATLRGSASRHDGRSTNLVAPNGSSQQAAIRAALHDAAVSPAEIDYLEAHGSGTPVGDPIEIEAAIAVLGDRPRPLVVGSVKSNIGHLEAAAGAAGVLKVALALQHKEIPPHLHMQSLNPVLAPIANRLIIPTTGLSWNVPAGRRRLAGVTSMGLSGTNVHVVMEEAPPRHCDAADTGPSVVTEATPQLLCLSARDEHALDDQARAFAEHLEHVSARDLAAQCFTANFGRTHFRHRLGLVATSPEAAKGQLVDFLGRRAPNVVTGVVGRRPKIAFLFTGHGSQHPGMGRRLLETEPTFRRTLLRASEVLEAFIPSLSLTELFLSSPSTDSGAPAVDDMALGQPALFAIQWALCELWLSWGVEPDYILGHSAGECAAACLAGALSFEDGIRLSAQRGKLLQSLPPTGAMVSVRADADQVQMAIGQLTADVSIAATNAPFSTVISGAAWAVDEVAHALQSQGVETKVLPISRPSHSAAVDPVLDDLEMAAAAMTCSTQLRYGMVSSLTATDVTAGDLSSPRYWRRQMRETVRFSDAVASLIAKGCDTFVEIGPQPLLLSLARECVPDALNSFAWLPSLRRDRDDRLQMLETVAHLHVRGCSPDWPRLYNESQRRRVALPTYPFQRARYRISPQRQPESLPSRRAAPRSFRDRLATAPPTVRLDHLGDRLRPLIADVLSCPRDMLSHGQNLIALGLTSLKSLDLALSIQRAFSVACDPHDLVSQATVGDIVKSLDAKLFPSMDSPHLKGPTVIPLNAAGVRVPLFCMHPSGGRVAAYLQLQAALGPDQPVYGIQSAGVEDPDKEYATLHSMAAAYASLVRDTCPRGPYRLAGWSMGGLIAHAVASELEQKGAQVDLLAMIDPVDAPSAGTKPDALTSAVWAAIQDIRPNLSAAERDLLNELTSGRSDDATQVIGSARAKGLPPDSVDAVKSIERAVRLYRHHFRLIHEHRPPVVAAPILQWWANPGHTTIDWSAHSSSPLKQRVLGGTHFAIIRSPHIEAIASEILSYAPASMEHVR